MINDDDGSIHLEVAELGLSGRVVDADMGEQLRGRRVRRLGVIHLAGGALWLRGAEL
eukprot:COSAG03_NODE_7869_length_863_cov_0.858639_2_plen_56_part_01